MNEYNHYFTEALNCSNQSGKSPLVEEYERALSAFFNVSNVVAVNSGSAAIQTALQEKVIAEIKIWYPKAVSWKHLKTYHIQYALPNDDEVINEPDYKAMRITAQCFVCGDHLLNGSINAAMKSGRLAAEAILNTMR